jgi:hypothetical protein
VATVPTVPTGYTLEEAESDIATLTGIVDRLAEAVPLADGPIPNVAAASGCTLYSAAGNLDFEGFDGNEYSTGRFTAVGPPSNQLITSATPANITGLAFGVNAGVYRINAKIGFTQGATASAQSVLLAVPAMNFTAMAINFYLGGSGSSSGCAWSNTATSPITITSPAFTATTSTFFLDLDMVVSFSAAGACTVQAAEAGGAHSFTVLANSFVDVMPVS